MPLIETRGNNQLSKPVASIKITEVTHFLIDGEPYSKGRYEVIDTFDPKENKVHFNGFSRIVQPE